MNNNDNSTPLQSQCLALYEARRTGRLPPGAPFAKVPPLRSLTAAACLLMAAGTGMPSHAQTLGIAYGGGGASGASGGPAAGGTGGNAGVSGPTAGSNSESGNGGANGGTALSGSPVSGVNGGQGDDGLSGGSSGTGGGGGAGGFGIVLSNASGSLDSNAFIFGGTGGVGAFGSYGGGGGGGGGTALYVETSTSGTSLTIDGAITAGAGGAGGQSGGGGYNTTSGNGGNSSGTGGVGATGNNGSGGGSGGGGGGGVQFVSTASGTTTITNNAIVTGGNGGNGGGDGGGNGRGGNAGNAGNGIELSGSRIQLTNTGSITGGNGAQGGPCDSFCGGGAGSVGAGGVGLVVNGGNNTVVNSGSIGGGVSGNGVTRANAMTLSGGGNTLELQDGYAFTGNVVSSSGTTNGGDTLALGGSTDSSFNLSQIGSQYQGFNNFQKTGTSTWVATGTTSTSWSITGGTLQIGDGGTTGTITGNIANDASLVFDRSNAVTYSGVISGSGDLTKQGAGTLTLSGANTYTGATDVSSGTMQAGAANVFGNGSAMTVASGATLDLNNFSQTLGSLAGSGNVALGAAMLTVGNNTSTTFSGTIDGSGGLTKQDSGTLTLSAANTYAGNTDVSAGTLRAGATDAFGTDSATTVASGATLDLNGFNQTLGSLAGSGNVDLGSAMLAVGTNNAGTAFSGTINGSGGLTKQGSGILSILGANTYTGDTAVSAGKLEFGSYNQNAGQTLGIGARSNTDYGKLAVIGTATFAADAAIAVDVAGVNTLGLGQQLSDVISAGTLNASTFDVTDNSSLFNFLAIRNGNAVDLLILPATGGVYDAVVANHVDSALGAARVLDRVLLSGAPAMTDIVTALGQLPTQQDVSRAAAQTLPLLAGGVQQSTLGMLSSFNGVVQDRQPSSSGTASGLSGGDGFTDRQAWAKAFGSRADQDDSDGTSGFSADSWGMAFGVDGELDRDTSIGVAYAYANSDVDGNTTLSGMRQRAQVDSHVLAVYGNRALADDLQLAWQADIGRHSTDGTRPIDFGGFTRTATSSYASYSAHIGAGLSKDIATDERTIFTPAIRADYTWLRDSSYRESGADALNLDVDANTTEALVLSAEGKIRHAVSDHAWLFANLGAGYDVINDRAGIVSAYAGAPGQAFTTTGIDHSPWIVFGGFGYTMQARQDMQITLRYDAEGRNDYINQTASVKASWAF